MQSEAHRDRLRLRRADAWLAVRRCLADDAGLPCFCHGHTSQRHRRCEHTPHRSRAPSELSKSPKKYVSRPHGHAAHGCIATSMKSPANCGDHRPPIARRAHCHRSAASSRSTRNHARCHHGGGMSTGGVRVGVRYGVVTAIPRIDSAPRNILAVDSASEPRYC